MSDPKFPSQEQGGYDPMPTSPDPLNPDEPGIDELPDNEGVIPLDDEAEMDPERVSEETDDVGQDKQRNRGEGACRNAASPRSAAKQS